MGFSARKRIKIADGVYQNVSYSKNGLHTSTSVKIGNATINSSKNGLRGTLNLSSILPGARYTTDKPSKTTAAAAAAEPPQTESSMVAATSLKVEKQKQCMPPPPSEKDPIVMNIDNDPMKEARKQISMFTATLNGKK